jgi:hypothetical protein
MCMTFRFRRLATLLGCFLVSIWGSYGQSLPGSPDRANNVRLLSNSRFDPWTNPTVGPYAPSSPGDPDLGEQYILRPQGGYQPFNFQLTQRALWTDNAALTDADELSDFYSDTELRLSYLPQIAANTFAEISAGYAFFRYADHSELDFDDLEASVGAIHVFRGLNDLSLRLRYNYERLLSGRSHDELFTDHSLEIGLYYPIALGPRNFAYGGYSSEFSLAGNPGYAARDEHEFIIGYTYSPTDRIELSSYYRLYVHDYVEGGRTDLLQTAGLYVTTHLTERIDLVLSASYSTNDSDLRGGDYDVGEAGAIVSLNFEF